MLDSLEKGREAEALAMAKKFDKWNRPTFLLTDQEIEATVASLSKATRDDIQFQQARVKAFTQAQMESIKEFRCELYSGVETGQRVIPVNCAGCYVPGGRFSHVASATMTIVTAKTCGVETVRGFFCLFVLVFLFLFLFFFLCGKIVMFWQNCS